MRSAACGKKARSDNRFDRRPRIESLNIPPVLHAAPLMWGVRRLVWRCCINSEDAAKLLCSVCGKEKPAMPHPQLVSI